MKIDILKINRIPVGILTLALLAVPAAAQTSTSDILKQYGIQPLQPANPASDFRLPNLAGGESSLSDFYGSWVVLTFFATWCGPCRSELPSLEKVHRERTSEGVVVLGVSVDDSREPLDPFVRQLGLTFPILWDQGKQVGRTYRASSIPISYLVDPQGRLAGVSRGARDWSALLPMLDAALAAVPATLTFDTPTPPADAYAAAADTVAAPSVSEPPTAEIEPLAAPPEAGEAFRLVVHLDWAGNFNEYLPQPPHVELPEGVVREDVTAESSSADGRSRVTYTLVLRAAEPGKYALDPVELRYKPLLGGAPGETLASRMPGPTVEVVPRTVLGLAPAVLGAGVAGVVLLGLVGWGVGRRLGGQRKNGAQGRDERYDELFARFEEARKKRMQGDAAAFFLALAELDEELGGADLDRADGVRAAVEGARYGGQVPPREELDNLQRRVERRLEELRGDPQAEARKSVQLRDA